MTQPFRVCHVLLPSSGKTCLYLHDDEGRGGEVCLANHGYYCEGKPGVGMFQGGVLAPWDKRFPWGHVAVDIGPRYTAPIASPPGTLVSRPPITLFDCPIDASYNPDLSNLMRTPNQYLLFDFLFKQGHGAYWSVGRTTLTPIQALAVSPAHPWQW